MTDTKFDELLCHECFTNSDIMNICYLQVIDVPIIFETKKLYTTFIFRSNNYLNVEVMPSLAYNYDLYMWINAT